MMEEKLYKNKDWMYHHYIKMEESTYVMAREAGCGQTAIYEWPRKFNIPTRAVSDAIFLAKRNYLDLSKELSDLLEGELLGDGSVAMSGQRSALYSHSSQYREYLVWLSKTFADLGLEQVGKIGKYWSKKSRTFYYNYTSRSYPELIPMRQRFYPEGEKIVPEDLILTSIMARQFYLGDGCLKKQARGRPSIVFYTNAFDKRSIDYLLEELRRNGFKATYQPSRNRIGMSVESVKDFLDYIGPCPIDCYQYKWNYGGIGPIPLEI